MNSGTGTKNVWKCTWKNCKIRKNNSEGDYINVVSFFYIYKPTHKSNHKSTHKHIINFFWHRSILLSLNVLY